MDALLDHVNPLAGTDSTHAFSSGNTLPLCALPFGMASWTFQTRREGRWLFHPQDRRFDGLRLTHQPSPWIGDYAHLTLMPQAGERLPLLAQRSSSYLPERAVFRPHALQARLLRYGIDLDFAPSARGGLLELAFRDPEEPKRLLFEFFEPDARIERGTAPGELLVATSANSGGVPDNFRQWLRLRLRNGARFGEILQGRDDGQAWGSVELEAAPGADHPIGIALAASFISPDQAALNLEREIGDAPIEEIRARAAAEWEGRLAAARIDASPVQKRVFYTCLYRCLLFPRALGEIDAEGARRHYSPYSGEVCSGPLYADNGFWDTHRALYPLLALLYPKTLEDILEGWLNAYRESGWLPKWASPGHRACMTGTHTDLVFAEAWSKGVPFDLETAWEAIRKNAFETSDHPESKGRVGLDLYQRLGYVPADRVLKSVSRTLEFAYGDYGGAVLAGAAGQAEAAQALRRRSLSYRNLFDPETGFMRARNEDGSWLEPFSPYAWGGPYVEGGPWQWNFAAPHDPGGLAALFGGDEALVACLDAMLEAEPRFETGYYKREIHEMSEMAAVDFGQYAHSNQPVHHVLYLYAAAGAPLKTQRWTRRVCRLLYRDGPNAYPGDEDNGEMSAWYLLSSLGLFPLCPGSGEHVFTTPLHASAQLRSESGWELRLEASGQGEGADYIAGLALDDVPWKRVALPHRQLLETKLLAFQLSPVPTRWLE